MLPQNLSGAMGDGVVGFKGVDGVAYIFSVPPPLPVTWLIYLPSDDREISLI